jgi:hypothetical protein
MELSQVWIDLIGTILTGGFALISVMTLVLVNQCRNVTSTVSENEMTNGSVRITGDSASFDE